MSFIDKFELLLFWACDDSDDKHLLFLAIMRSHKPVKTCLQLNVII